METIKETDIKLTEQFIKGLKKYRLSKSDMGLWHYCGGSYGSHKKYFKLSCPHDDQPALKDKCICGHTIKNNCYITDNKDFLILGNCCIQKFIIKKGRTCKKCGEPHKNRLLDLCNSCKITSLISKCMKCNEKCRKSHKLCYSCFLETI
jgi:hypothetical protein